jgi:hypothetical protein
VFGRVRIQGRANRRGRSGTNPAFRARFARRLTEEVAVPHAGDRDRPTREVQAGDVVEQAAKPVRLLARVGLVAYGLIHLVVAALIVQVVFGDRERADKKGALQEIAESGSGRLLLWVVVAGLAALVVLRLVDAVSAYRRLDGWRRVGRMTVAAGEAVVYTVLARSAATIAQAEGGDSFSKSVVAALFGLPGGPFLVGLVGVALVAAGGYAVVHGLRREFLHDLALPPRFRTAVGVLGTVGWTALGAAGATAGVLLVAAAIQFDPAAPVGLDAGIRALAGQPFGPVLLLVLAAGLAVFAAYCLFDARYRTE